jgi:DNA-binding beta-propeller fold protein YncE
MDKFNFNKVLAYSFFIAISFASSPIIAAEESTEYGFERLWPQLEHPWYFPDFYYFRLTATSDGNVYIQDMDRTYIRKFSEQGKLLQTWDENAWLSGMLSGYTDVIAPDGSIYFYKHIHEEADIQKHRIFHFSSEGKFIRSWGNTGSKEGELGHKIYIHILQNGHIYTTDEEREKIQYFDNEGKFISETKWKGYDIKSTWNYPVSVVMAPDDSVYVSDCNTSIKQYTAEGDLIQKWQHQEYRQGNNHGLEIRAVSEKGDLYFFECLDEHFNHSAEHYYIHQFNAKGEFIKSWKDILRTGWRPFYVSPGPDGVIYFSYLGGVKKFNEDGKLLQTWTSLGTDAGKFKEPRDIAIAPNGSVYVADTDNNRIQQFDADGNFIRMWGHFGSEDGEFKSPVSLTVAKDNSVYVIDYHNNRIQQFSAEGTFIRSFAKHNTGQKDKNSEQGDFEWPYNAIGHDGSVYISDSKEQRIQHFDTEGKLLRTWTTFKQGYNEALHPYDISIAHDGSLYVRCSDNLIQHYSAEGKFISSWQLEVGIKEGQFRDPRAMAIAPDGSLYIADTGNNRIQKFVLK